MTLVEGLIVFDIASICIMMLISYLSKQLGGALKIPPYYRIFYVTSFIVFICAVLDSFHNALDFQYLTTITLSIRMVSGIVALIVCFPYWKWLFSEYFSK